MHRLGSLFFKNPLQKSLSLCKEENFLSSQLYDTCKIYLKKNPDLSFLPKAEPASANVFLPPDLPVVFKQAGEKKSIDRFFRMCQIRTLCKGSHYTCLIVPKARPHGPFIIEEKLPLKELTQKGQIGLYCENRDKFSQAVREFTGLLCQTLYSDILTFSHPYRQEIPLGRYDNIPFFLDEDVGKIGLVDLEEAEARRHPISKEDANQVARTAISLFPLHFYEILSVLQENLPNISLDLEELEKYQKEVLKNFCSIYQDHRAFIARKEPLSASFFSKDRKQELREKMSSHVPMNNFIEKLIETIEQTAGRIASQEISIAHVLARTLTFPIPEPKEDREFRRMITPILEELQRNEEICFANIYYNRAHELRVRIHF